MAYSGPPLTKRTRPHFRFTTGQRIDKSSACTPPFVVGAGIEVRVCVSKSRLRVKWAGQEFGLYLQLVLEHTCHIHQLFLWSRNLLRRHSTTRLEIATLTTTIMADQEPEVAGKKARIDEEGASVVTEVSASTGMRPGV